MADYNYYCEVKFHTNTVPVGVYSFTKADNQGFGPMRPYVQMSDRVWRQGPKGGVKIIKDRGAVYHPAGYVTTNEKLMKEFMWVKLSAGSVRG